MLRITAALFVSVISAPLFLILISTVVAAPRAIGQGCTTVYYIDKDCDGYGVGKKSSGIYPLGDNTALGSPGTYTMGDMPDADDEDPAVNTTASWEAKWGKGNQAIVNFLQQRKGFTNTSRVFYLSQDGNDATAKVNDPTHPYRHARAVPVRDWQGGAVIVRGGNWTDLYMGGPCYYDETGAAQCYNWAGSPGKPLYVMNYPGELVVSNAPIGHNSPYAPKDRGGYITFDGINLRADKYGMGDGVTSTSTTDFGYINAENVGWHQNFWGNATRNALVQGNIFHDIRFHTVYFGWCCWARSFTPSGDFDFAADAAGSRIASYDGKVLDNIMYNNGLGGYEPIHINTYARGVKVNRNIVAYSGGSGVSFQSGISDSEIKNNVIFDNGRDAITFLLFQSGMAASLYNNVIEGNTIWVGSGNDKIRATNPSGAFIAQDSSAEGTKKIYNNTIRNNVMLISGGAGQYDPPFFRFNKNSYPATNTIENNILWTSRDGQTFPANGKVMSVSADAQGPASGDFTFDQFSKYSATYKGNLLADPKFVSASQTYTLTPERFDFRVQLGSPAIARGWPIKP